MKKRSAFASFSTASLNFAPKSDLKGLRVEGKRENSPVSVGADGNQEIPDTSDFRFPFQSSVKMIQVITSIQSLLLVDLFTLVHS